MPRERKMSSRGWRSGRMRLVCERFAMAGVVVLLAFGRGPAAADGDATIPTPANLALSRARPSPEESPGTLKPDPAAGAAKAGMCGGCHGADGNSPNPEWPKLAGQRFEYIVKQLHDFRAGRRVDPVMSAMAAPLSDQDIVDVAAHFSSQSIRLGTAAEALMAEGRRLYWQGRPREGVFPCIGCHGATGEGAGGGIEGGFPAVGGQNANYLLRQLKNFRSGARTNDWEGVMQLVTGPLSDEEAGAVSAFLSALDRGTP